MSATIESAQQSYSQCSTLPVQGGSNEVRLFITSEREQNVRGALNVVCRMIEEQGIHELRRRGVLAYGNGIEISQKARIKKLMKPAAYIRAMGRVAKAFDIATRGLTTPMHGNVPMRGELEDMFGRTSTMPTQRSDSAENDSFDEAIIVHLDDNADMICGRGTLALELELQVSNLLAVDPAQSAAPMLQLNAVVAPMDRGGELLAGTCAALRGTGIRVFGVETEPRDDVQHACPTLMTSGNMVQPHVGNVAFSAFTASRTLSAVFDVTEKHMRQALQTVHRQTELVFIKSSAMAPLALILHNEEFRQLIAKQVGQVGGWNVGVIL